MNKILFTSIGRRNYLVDFAKENNIIVHCTNNKYVPSLSKADYFKISPNISSDEYVNFILEYCVKNNIDIVIPLLDIDVLKLSKFHFNFSQIGVRLFSPEYKYSKLSFDKSLFYIFCKSHNIKTPKLYNLENCVFPSIIKPKCGFGSKNTFVVNNKNELFRFYDSDVHIIQEYIQGFEYNVNCYNGIACSVKKMSMFNGETEICEVIDDYFLKETSLKILSIFGNKSILDIDYMEDYIIDVNPRFGGVYPFCHYSGYRFLNMLFENDYKCDTFQNGIYYKCFSINFLPR